MSQLSQSLAGALLVASPELDDDLFRRTVIYIAAHDRKSTTGLVLNRPLKFLITQLFPEIKQPLPLYWGGPVGYDTMFFLHRCPQWIPGGLSIGAGTYWGGERASGAGKDRRERHPLLCRLFGLERGTTGGRTRREGLAATGSGSGPVQTAGKPPVGNVPVRDFR